ncbi:Vng6275h (plasmid) [Halobacterium salinarum NRC-1]|uniref:Spurious ORF n=1 Tax=Halobacterium salinarum (strain ATCC 700922 / JCM 11081 / NRC-1) TaxID=64091 RepID=Q9HHR0_HALSA|nr:Vng6275h [Halobacterium salinarum NRC-1]DAC79881.1 TPA_inf: spurious ORF [Halobacterium salinarum NRC-1]
MRGWGCVRHDARGCGQPSERRTVVLVLVHVLHAVSFRRHDRGTGAARAHDGHVIEVVEAFGEATFDGVHRHRCDAATRARAADRDGRGAGCFVDLPDLEVAAVLLDLGDVVTEIVARLSFEVACAHCGCTDAP